MSKNSSQRNVTFAKIITVDDKEKHYFPCPICKKMLLVKYSKKSKPYCVCNDCGVQLFVRVKNGIDRLKNLICDEKLPNNPNEISNTLDYFNELKKRLE